MEQGQSRNHILPAPTGGWNARDPIHAVPENQALEMVNYFPDVASVKNRGGSEVWCTFADLTNRVYVLMNLIDDDGDELLFAVTKDGSANVEIWSIASNGTETLEYSSFTNPRCFWCQFRNRLIVCNGSNAPIDIEPDTTVNATAWTGGPGGGISELIFPTPFKNRLYFSAYASTSIYYGPVDSIGGALTEFSLSSVLHYGGLVNAIGSSTKLGETNQNLFAVISSEGEVLVYSGSYPGGSDWALVGRFLIGKPAGAGCIFYLGSDLHFLTVDGVVPLNVLLSDQREGVAGGYVATSANIQNAFQEAGSAYYGNVGWQGLYAPTYKMLIVNVPTVDLSESEQFVMNLLTGAWCKFTGLDSISWTVYNDIVYFGGVGYIYKLHAVGNSLNSDNGTPFEAYWRQGFSFLGNPEISKHIIATKAFFDLTQESGHDQNTRTIQLGMNADFDDGTDADSVILRDVTADGTVHYALICETPAEGSTFGLVVKSNLGSGYLVAWNMFIVACEDGGYLS